MTSATGKKRPRAATRAPEPGALKGRSRGASGCRCFGLRSPAGRARGGFTLLELVLAISLMLVLAGLVIVSFAGAAGGEGLEEGAGRFETALRMARAQASGTGRRFCLVLADAQGAMRVLWEPEPLVEPGQFVAYERARWPDRLPSGILQVTRMELSGPSVYRLLGVAGSPFSLADVEATPEEVDLLMFNADGTCDSALVELATLDGDDPRRAVVELDGRTGTVTGRILTSTELEEFYEARAE